MRKFTKPLPLSVLLSLAWTKVKTSAVDCCRQSCNDIITVTTNSGPVKGYKTPSSCDNYEYINFLGIPYALPPIGDLRFKDPQPFEPSDNIINQQFWRKGSIASQSDVAAPRTIGSEDCLHLSVYTRDIKPDILKPVMVWIHGGAFMIGSNSKDFYGPDFLLRNDIVLIAINYRLGAFGFSSYKDPEVGIPGNAGLKDQVVALKWIKENCAYFGGDPENITLFGESAGAASVSLHMVTNQSKGLFHKAIMMSGNLYAPWVINPVEDWTQRLAGKLGWNGEGGDRACLSVLQRASDDEIAKAQDHIVTALDRRRYTYFPFGPSIEPYESAQCFISKDPKELCSSAWSKDIPVIVCTCSDEGLLLYKDTMKRPDELPKVQLEYTLPFHDFGLDVGDTLCREIAKSLKELYFGFLEPSIDTIFFHLMIMTDRCFAHPTHRLIVSRVKNQCGPTYLLRFNFDSPYSLVKRLFAGKNIPGTCHADDCSYYFRSEFAGPDPPKHSDEWKTIVRMCDSLTSFAKTGNPNNSSIAPVEWKPVEFETIDEDTCKYKCLNVSNQVSYIDWPEMERVRCWDQVFEQFNNNVKISKK